MKDVRRNAEIIGRKVNHTGRKATVKTLVHGGVQGTLIMQVLGHKNEHSLKKTRNPKEHLRWFGSGTT